MALVGFRYITPTDPFGTGTTLGYQWLDTSGSGAHGVAGDVYERNSSDTAWVWIGNVNQPNYGLVPVGGATMTGPLLGPHGLAFDTNMDFSGSVKRSGINLVDTNDLAASIAAQNTALTDLITQSLAAASSGISVKANMTVKSGIAYDSGSNLVTNGYTIALPQYADGTTAKTSEVQTYDAAIACFSIYDNTISARYRYVYLKESTPNSRNFKLTITSDDGSAWEGSEINGPGTAGANWGIFWIIVAAR